MSSIAIDSLLYIQELISLDDEIWCIQNPDYPDYNLCGKFDPSPPVGWSDKDETTCPDCSYLDTHGFYFVP